MLDVGWTELVVIAIVLIVVVGPKDLPPMLRTFGKMMSKMRGMATDFRHQFDEALREADLDDVRKTISDAQRLNPAHSLREAMNPLRQMGNEIKADLQKATRADEKPAAEPPAADVPPAPTIAASVATPVTASSTPVAPLTPASVVPVDGVPLAEITATAPSALLAGDGAIAAKPRKKAAKRGTEASVVAVDKPAPRKRAAKPVPAASADTPRKRKTADKPKTGDDA